MNARRSSLIGLLLALLVTGLLAVQRPSLGAATGMPDHFAIGVTAAPDNTGLTGWMPSTHVPWDFAYQYLAGGVNTSDAWTNWNPNGTFPLNYARTAAAHHYIPVFPYYELLQSSGGCDSCGEAQRDLTHVNSAGLMNNYYETFAVLMKRLGPKTYDGIKGFGGTAIVQIEPDFSAYAQQAALDNGANCYGFCTRQGNDPSFVKASVAGSGFAAVHGFANTFRGFILALDHLRDLYAPNVLLAFHVSNWAALHDIGSETNPGLDPVSLGRIAGTFAVKSGVSSHGVDLVFNDVADRDAGYYKYVRGQDVFWDRRNVELPNFVRWERYIAEISRVTSRKVYVWQIPVGNQVYRTENNTDGHYQDNRAEYFFSHIAELVRSGIGGLLFGAGNPGSSVQWDGKGDGATNPASKCTSDGTSGTTICPSKTSTVSDDDGGYLRAAAAAYYREPYSFASARKPAVKKTNKAPSSTPSPTRSVAPSTAPSPVTSTPSPSASPSKGRDLAQRETPGGGGPNWIVILVGGVVLAAGALLIRRRLKGGTG